MKLFTVGPVLMDKETLAVRSEQIPYFRTNEFSELVLNTAKNLKDLMGTSQDSKAIFITGSGSASMEAVVSNSFDETDNILVINGGSFGSRFKKLCEIYNLQHDEIHLDFGEELSSEHFNKLDGKKYTALLVNIHETSTGQLYDINLISNFCKKNNIYLVVDAISSFLSDPYEMDNWNIDCTIISSQKAMALAPGLSMVVMNNRFYENKVKDKPMKNLYLNLNEHIKNMERGQTPNTPAVGIILELNDKLKRIKEFGLENYINKAKENADFFRNEIKNLPIKTPNYKLSNTLTPLIFENNRAKVLYTYLREKYDITVTPNGGELADKVLRVGHIGNISKSDLKDLIQKMKEVL